LKAPFVDTLYYFRWKKAAIKLWLWAIHALLVSTISPFTAVQAA